MTKIDDRLIAARCSVREALSRLDALGQGMLLLVDGDGRLVRTVTDGDVRRLLLAGKSLDTTLEALPEKPPTVARVGTADANLLAVMDQKGIDHVPLVDASGRPTRVVHRREIDAPILLSTPHLSEYERAFVEDAFQTNWLAPLGPNVDAFEKELADAVGTRAAAAVSSGTAGLHLALRVLDVAPGDVVFCSTLTFIASVNPILYVGAVPVFIDSEPESWNLSPAALERAFVDAAATDRLPKAVIVVNLYGQSADYTPICELCEQYRVPIIEDAAESLGATYRGRASGTIGRIGVYSFNGNKIITTSGGGMLVSDEPELITKAKFLSTQAREPAPYYQHKEIGYNYRMSNVLAGIGRGQLRVLDERVDARRQVFQRYREMLSDVPELVWMPDAPFGRSTRWLTAARVQAEGAGETRDALIRHLAEHRIEARHVWKPMHRQPLFEGTVYYPYREGTSVSDTLFDEGLCLPSGSNLTVQQQERIVRAIKQALRA